MPTHKNSARSYILYFNSNRDNRKITIPSQAARKMTEHIGAYPNIKYTNHKSQTQICVFVIFTPPKHKYTFCVSSVLCLS